MNQAAILTNKIQQNTINNITYQHYRYRASPTRSARAALALGLCLLLCENQKKLRKIEKNFTFSFMPCQLLFQEPFHKKIKIKEKIILHWLKIFQLFRVSQSVGVLEV